MYCFWLASHDSRGTPPSLCVCACVENLETDCCPLFMQNHLRIQFTLCCPAIPLGKKSLLFLPSQLPSPLPFCSLSSPYSPQDPTLFEKTKLCLHRRLFYFNQSYCCLQWVWGKKNKNKNGFPGPCINGMPHFITVFNGKKKKKEKIQKKTLWRTKKVTAELCVVYCCTFTILQEPRSSKLWTDPVHWRGLCSRV